MHCWTWRQRATSRAGRPWDLGLRVPLEEHDPPRPAEMRPRRMSLQGRELLTARRSQRRCVAERAGLRLRGAVVEWQLDVQRCARAGRALEREGAADRLGAVLEAKQSRATGGIGTALAVVADRDGEHVIVQLHV